VVSSSPPNRLRGDPLIVLAIIGVPLLLVGVVVLVLTIRSLGRSLARAEVQRAPLLAMQQVTLPCSGDLRLCLEGPRGLTWRAPLRFALAEAATGRPVTLTPTLSGSGRQRLDRSLVQRAQLILPGPGTYTVRVEGFQPGQDYRSFALVFMRPFTATIVLHVLGLVACGFATIGGLVLSILGLALQ
jgi:hypothetical protein